MLHRWETPELGAFASHEMFSLFNLLFILVVILFFLFFYLVVKERPELKEKFKERVQEAIKFVSTIDDFDELVDPRILARHCLGPKPSDYVLCAIDRE